jgi:hypothetical protein
MSSPVSYDLQGQGGGVVLSAGEAAQQVRWIQCVTDCVIDSITADNLSGANVNLVGPTIPAGVGIGGRIESVLLLSGLAIAYYL